MRKREWRRTHPENRSRLAGKGTMSQDLMDTQLIEEIRKFATSSAPSQEMIDRLSGRLLQLSQVIRTEGVSHGNQTGVGS